MDNRTYFFNWSRFLDDLRLYAGAHSYRAMHAEISEIMSMTTLWRICNAKKAPDVFELSLLCCLIGQSPSDYFDVVAF